MPRPEQPLPPFLSPSDPEPLDRVNMNGKSRFVLCCEHAGRTIPASLGDLGLVPADMDRHIACDVGAEGVARRLSDLLDAPLFVQRYSRLVVDCNRPYGAADLMPEVSDGTPVPANCGLGEAQRRQRYDAIHVPFHLAISAFLDQRIEAGRSTVLIAVHSFTPRLVGGQPRPWHFGVLSNRDPGFSLALLEAFGASNPHFVIAHNEPYVVDDMSDYTIPVHGEARGIDHALMEIRNDLISDDAGQAEWAGLVAAALTKTSEQKRVA